MKKPASLRAAITAILPEFARDPDRLAMWIDRGTTRATQNRQRGFSWEYTLTLVAENYTRPPELLFFLVCDWLRAQQPDLLASNTPGFAFEVDLIDDKTFDVKITLQLTEAVSAQAVEGGWQLAVVEEPPALFPDAEPLRTLEAPIASIWVRGQDAPYQVAPDAEAA